MTGQSQINKKSFTAHQEELRLIAVIEQQWKDHEEKIRTTEDELEREVLVGRGPLSLLTALYCHPNSSYYKDEQLLDWMMSACDGLLAGQLTSGCISLANCNIDSPPDTAFQVHGMTLVYSVMRDSGINELGEAMQKVELFLQRAKKCLLTGGIHTPNHRWVMCGALANMYELFPDEALKERAFEFFSEELDITSYGEWTERSNAMYNSALAIHLIDAAEVFGFESGWEAVRSNLLMMRYMFHPDDTIATEYSGRQDLGVQAKMNDWYYTSLHLMANKEQSEELVALAKYAEQTAAAGSHALMYWMQKPEAMALPDSDAAMPDQYSIFLGEGNSTLVPVSIPYLGKFVQHPHGAPLVRHRRGDLSVTLMSGQQDILYLQYKKARMVGYRIGLGWFGIGSVAFPSIIQKDESTYQLEVDLEGCYFEPLPRSKTEGLHGSFVDMPNQERGKTHQKQLNITLEVKLLDDGVDLTVISQSVPNIFVQHIFQFTQDSSFTGEGIKQTEHPLISRLTSGEACIEQGDGCISIGPGEYRHLEIIPRNDRVNHELKRLVINSKTPIEQTISIRCFEAVDEL